MTRERPEENKKVGRSEKVNHMQMKFFYCISLKTEDLL